MTTPSHRYHRTVDGAELAGSPAPVTGSAPRDFGGAIVVLLGNGTGWVVITNANFLYTVMLGSTTRPSTLRMAQRNDGLGFNGHPRLHASTSRAATAPRLGQRYD